MTLFTVGHGTLPGEDLARLLTALGIEAVVDVRRFPGSRRHPQFSRDAMAEWLPAGGVAYRWEERLGGRRRRRPDSPNDGLRDASFQAYADYMAEPAFWSALDDVLRQTGEQPTAILCSESVWWRCHRRLVADAAVLVRGADVRHVLHDGRVNDHAITDVARRENDHVTYRRQPTP